MPRFNTRQFTYTKDCGDFCAEASTVCPDQVPTGGFELQSARTGDIVQYVLYQTSRDREGDVTVWIFHATDASEKARPTVTIFND